MNLTHQRLSTHSALLAFALSLSAAAALAAESAPTNSPPPIPSATPPLQLNPGSDFRNWIEFSYGNASVQGETAQFQKRFAVPEGTRIGIEEFHFEKDFGKKGMLELEGRGIFPYFDNHDVDLRLDVTDPDKGYLRAGYSEFRTWYNGNGGFFPTNSLWRNNPAGAWVEPREANLAIDRANTYVQLGLTIPDHPVIALEYRHVSREGEKESLAWGEVPFTNRTSTATTTTRGIAPAFWKIDEQRDIFLADVTHSVGPANFGVGVRYELGDNDNSRNMRRSATTTNDRVVTQIDALESDLFNAHAFTQVKLSDKVRFSSAYSFTRMDNNPSGSRIYGADYEPAFLTNYPGKAARDEGFIDLEGTAKLRQHVANFNLEFQPATSLFIVPSVRVEKQELDSESRDVATSVGTTSALLLGREDFETESRRGILDVSEAIEARYSGITNWVFYVRGNWMEGQGDQFERQINEETKAVTTVRNTDFNRSSEKYTVGITWYPARRLTLAAQYYYKNRKDTYDHLQDSTTNEIGSNRYPAFLRAHHFDTHDANLRLTWRPISQLTSVTRYDYTLNTIEMQGAGLKPSDSAEVTAHILSETLTWTPMPRLYLQGSASVAWDNTDTPADTWTASFTNVTTKGEVVDFKNNYWEVSALAGCVLDDRTDFRVQYTYYRASDFIDNARTSQPYGADAKEQSVTATLVRQISQNLQWTLRYGYVTSRDQTSGGHNDYNAHLAFTSIRYFF